MIQRAADTPVAVFEIAMGTKSECTMRAIPALHLKKEHPAALASDWMFRFRLNLKPIDYLKGDQNSAGATSESLLKVVAGTFGIASTEKVPKLLLSMSAPPEL